MRGGIPYHIGDVCFLAAGSCEGVDWVTRGRRWCSTIQTRDGERRREKEDDVMENEKSCCPEEGKPIALYHRLLPRSLTLPLAERSNEPSYHPHPPPAAEVQAIVSYTVPVPPTPENKRVLCLIPPPLWTCCPGECVRSMLAEADEIQLTPSEITRPHPSPFFALVFGTSKVELGWPIVEKYADPCGKGGVRHIVTEFWLEPNGSVLVSHSLAAPSLRSRVGRGQDAFAVCTPLFFLVWYHF